MTAITNSISLNGDEPRIEEDKDYENIGIDSPVPEEFRGQRLLDFLVAFAVTVLLSPLILLRATSSLLLTGRLLKQQDSAESSTFLVPSTPAASFSGKLPGAGLAGLFNVMGGSQTLVASSIGSGRPGLFSADRLRQGLGVEYLEGDNNESVHPTWGISEYFRILAKSLLAKLASPVSDVQSGADFNLFGIRVINTTMPELLDECEEILSNRVQTSIGFVNADCMNKCFTNDDYHQTLRNMNQVYPDGI